MSDKTFRRGGIHPAANKDLSKERRTERLPLPASVTVPLSQHVGAPAVAVVARGDRVKTGQLIARSNGHVSANVHSPVTGVVASVGNFTDAAGFSRQGITIAAESDEWADGIDTGGKIVRECHLEPGEIIARIAEAGVVGLGGAAFPTHVKLNVTGDKPIEYLIINGAECEPYLAADHRLMLEYGEEMLIGVRILAKALGADKIIIAIETNKPDAIELIDRLKDIVAPMVEVLTLRERYPQGSEKQLIEAVTGREVPAGGLPFDVGVMVHNVSTAFAVYEAVQKRRPLIEKIVTVTGRSVLRPSNVWVRIGTPLSALISHIGGLPEGTGKVIVGGPMMGKAVSNLDGPVMKATSGVLLMDESESHRGRQEQCMRCGRCMTVCPMLLEPYLLGRLSMRMRWDEAETHYITDCMECGCCVYACPSNIPLLDYIRLGKAEVIRITRRRKD